MPCSIVLQKLQRNSVKCRSAGLGEVCVGGKGIGECKGGVGMQLPEIQ